jgi:hypothetical protein
MKPKKAYKELQLCLKNSFTMSLGEKELGYSIVAGIYDWLKHSDIEPTNTHFNIICDICDGIVPYPYIEPERMVIIRYLALHKYKEFKKDKMKCSDY